MALAHDASTPAIASGTYSAVTTRSIASNSFSPPAGAVIVCTALAWNSYSPNGWTAPTITDSLGSHLTWNLFKSEAPTTSGYNMAIWAWWAYTASAQTAMTVTPTVTASGGSDVYEADTAIDVWTGASTSAPIGVTTSGIYNTTTTLSVPITPGGSNSALMLAGGDGQATTSTVAAGTGTYLNNVDGGHTPSAGGSGWYGSSSGPTLTSSAKTLSLTGGTGASFSYIGYEVVAGGGASSGTATGQTSTVPDVGVAGVAVIGAGPNLTITAYSLG